MLATGNYATSVTVMQNSIVIHAGMTRGALPHEMQSQAEMHILGLNILEDTSNLWNRNETSTAFTTWLKLAA